MPEERLQKVLAAAGVASRRASEALIQAGRVRVDGRIATIGEQVDPASARIEVDGQPVGIGARRAYVALHKPAGVTSTTRDRHADATVLELLPTALVPDGARVYPVGRLDRDSEGLLLLTNDGDWAERVLHPRFRVQREYAVGLAVPLDREQARVLRDGVTMEEGIATLDAPLRPATATETRLLAALLDPSPDPRLTWYRAVLAQGWKRQLRRMFAAVGAPVARLVRVRIGAIRIDRLPSGRARALRAPEIRAIAAGSASGPPDRRREGRPSPGRSGPGRSSSSRSSRGRATRPVKRRTAEDHGSSRGP